MKIRFAVVLATCVLTVPAVHSQCISLTGSTYTQNFDTLASSGTSSVVPAGWAFSETGTNANLTYTAGTGSGNAGDTYSFGSSGSTERAFGGLQSGSLVPTIGACFQNNTGTTLTSLSVAYTGEQWRFGATARADRLDFQYSTNATALNTGTWTDVDALDFTSPNTTAAVGALDGNAAGNRTAISGTIGAIAIANGASFWIRWSDFNAAGADDGLAVDDFSLSTGGTVASSISINDVSANEGDSGTTTFHFIVSLSPASASAVSFDIATADGTATAGSDYVAASLTGQTIPAGSTSYGFDVAVNGDTSFEPDETFFVNLTNVTSGVNVAKAQGVGTIKNDDSSGPPLVPPGTIEFSQVYGGGGNSGATLKNDFVELYNRSNAAVTLDGWSVQYTGATASFPNGLTPLSGVIQPHSYFLVKEAQGAGGTQDLPAADVTGAIPMGATAGKVALVQSTVGLSGSCPTGANISDFVGYGSANCSEGMSIGLLSNTTAAFRLLGGCKENNVNATDFFVASPAPRNSASPGGPDCSTAVETFTPHVVISQLYPGGGNGGASLSNDFIELYNPTSGPVNLNGWSLQYTSATGNTWGVSTLPLGGKIQAGEYFLIGLASGGTNGSPLPSPRITGDINMAATVGGKILLARTTNGLTGNCPIGDPSLVDLVGYGAADCYTGGLNAPIPGDTATAILRKNNGNQNTDQNSVDFATGTPNPQRGSGAPIDLPPFITSEDPVGADAPFDASITINISKGVNVSGTWYTINCGISGAHGDVTVNSAFSQTAYILTPNVTFVPGETCNVHIAGNLVVEVGGLAQTLTSDTDFSFTIATGAPSVDAADVNLVMGNPTGASFADDNNRLMVKPQFSESYNRAMGRPNWVSWHLTDAWSPSANSTGRTNTFRPDPALPSTWYRVLHTDFSGSGFDRGHMCPSADRTANIPINEATFLMSNMVAQAPDNNQGPWVTLEDYLRTLLPANDVYIVSGPAGQGGTGSNGPASTVANGNVVVPAFTWKAALAVPKGLTNPAQVTASMRTIAVIMPNIQGIKGDDWQKKDANGNYVYVTTVDAVETLCSCNLFSNVPEAIRNAINAGTNGANPPGTANESVSATEDTTQSFSLIAAAANSNPLTYNIVTGPSNGTLGGTDANRTYTPAPDFNGSDSFTFSVSDGTLTSNTSTVSISVSEVNDPPVAADDAKSVEAGSALTFPASDLTANDVAGPANESSQTLTVTSVSNATHGAVSLTSGQISFTPVVPYAGPASFTYQVCDNGTTNGAADPRCTTATVNVTVGDTTPPTMSNLVLSSTQLWPPNHKMVDINVAYTVSDLGDAAPVCSVGITSNEPVNGTGDGDSSPDWEVVNAHQVRLRAERAGNGSGRIYTINAACSDASGNVAQKSATVSVPKSQGK